MIKRFFRCSKEVRTLPGVLTTILLLLMVALMPAAKSFADAFTAHHIIDTSVAFGTAFGDIFADLDSVAAGTSLSAELANTIENDSQNSPNPPNLQYLPDPRLSPVLSNIYGTMDNHTFLTSALTIYGNAGQQLVDAFNAHFTSLNALIGGVGTWTITTPTDAFLNTVSYTLLGRTVSLGDPTWTRDEIGVPDDTCTAVGTANVDFYEVTGHFDANGATAPIPEPATMFLLGTGLIGLIGLRRRFKK